MWRARKNVIHISTGQYIQRSVLPRMLDEARRDFVLNVPCGLDDMMSSTLTNIIIQNGADS